jgi:hypothetical protein
LSSGVSIFGTYRIGYLFSAETVCDFFIYIIKIKN